MNSLYILFFCHILGIYSSPSFVVLHLQFCYMYLSFISTFQLNLLYISTILLQLLFISTILPHSLFVYTVHLHLLFISTILLHLLFISTISSHLLFMCAVLRLLLVLILDFFFSNRTGVSDPPCRTLQTVP